MHDDVAVLVVGQRGRGLAVRCSRPWVSKSGALNAAAVQTAAATSVARILLQNRLAGQYM